MVFVFFCPGEFKDVGVQPGNLSNYAADYADGLRLRIFAFPSLISSIYIYLLLFSQQKKKTISFYYNSSHLLIKFALCSLFFLPLLVSDLAIIYFDIVVYLPKSFLLRWS